MKTIESDFKFLDYKLTKFEYSYNLIDQSEDNIKYNVIIAPKIYKSGEQIDESLKDQNVVRIDLNVKISGKIGKRVLTKLNCEVSGFFTSKKLSQEDITRFASISGVANLLSIVRSVIISFTSQTGNKPIIVPLINLIETYKRKKSDLKLEK